MTDEAIVFLSLLATLLWAVSVLVAYFVGRYHGWTAYADRVNEIVEEVQNSGCKKD